jgi:hypothetical protein
MSETRKSNAERIYEKLGCVFWPLGIGLFFVWLAGHFNRLYCSHVAAIAAFGLALLGFNEAVVSRLKRCPHGVRGAVASPPLCAACLIEKKVGEHIDKLGRKRRGRERAASASDPLRDKGFP